MKKIIIAVLLWLLVPMCISADAKDVEIYMFGKEIVCDVPPVIENSRTLVPVRAVSEGGLGAHVEWDGTLRRVTVTMDGFEILLTIGDTRAYVNGEEKLLDVPARIISDRTVVPLRFVAETFDCSVGWDNDNRRVIIEKKKGEIKSIQVEQTPNDNLLNLELSSYEEPEIFTLDSPHRIVMDFKSLHMDAPDGKEVVKSGYINEVRWANHEDFYRIVVECNGVQPHTLVKTGDNTFSIIVGTPETRAEQEGADKPEEDVDTDNNEDSFREEESDKDSEEEKDNDEDKDGDEEKDSDTDEEEKKPVDRGSAKKNPSGEGPLVVLDAGHGGKDSGAIGKDPWGNVIYDDNNEIYIMEKDINLSVALKVYRYLLEADVNVMMTRDEDEFLELREIADVANDAGATLFVSIHSNSVENVPTANGTEVLYYDTEEKNGFGISSKELADNILDSMMSTVDMLDRGLKERPGLAVLKWSRMPAALVELGFVTNSSDQKKLIDKSWQEDAAWAIAQGIIDSLKAIE